MKELNNENWTWQEALYKYEDDLYASGRHASSTIKIRLNLLQKVVSFANKKGVNKPSDLNKTLIVEYFKSRKLANSTKLTQKRFISHFVDFLESNFVVLENVAELIPSPKVHSKERIIPTQSELEILYKNILAKKEPRIMLRDLAIVDLLINPGLRISELVKLKIKDVFFEEQKILVTRKGGSEVMLPVQDRTLDRIKKMLNYRQNKENNDALFVASRRVEGREKGLGVRGAQKLIRKYMLGSFELNKRSYGPHLLRHTGGTMLHKNGVDIVTIQKLFGHKNIETTMIYQHTEFEDLQRAVKKGENFANSFTVE